MKFKKLALGFISSVLLLGPSVSVFAEEDVSSGASKTSEWYACLLYTSPSPRD